MTLKRQKADETPNDLFFRQTGALEERKAIVAMLQNPAFFLDIVDREGAKRLADLIEKGEQHTLAWDSF